MVEKQRRFPQCSIKYLPHQLTSLNWVTVCGIIIVMFMGSCRVPYLLYCTIDNPSVSLGLPEAINGMFNVNLSLYLLHFQMTFCHHDHRLGLHPICTPQFPPDSNLRNNVDNIGTKQIRHFHQQPCQCLCAGTSIIMSNKSLNYCKYHTTIHFTLSHSSRLWSSLAQQQESISNTEATNLSLISKRELQICLRDSGRLQMLES